MVTAAAPAVAKDVTCAGKVATIVGTNASERIVGTNGRDVIAARGGNDVVVGKGGGDIICGGAGRDTLRGNRGADKLFGGKGDDPLDGGLGRDLCDQGPGRAGKKNCELPGRGMVVAPTPEPEPKPTPKPEPPAGPSRIDLAANDILAVAYSDIDGLDGYSTGDVLIAKLVDTAHDGVPSVGDTIAMGRYPLDFAASAFGDFGITSHVVTSVFVTSGLAEVTSAEGDHQWWIAPMERYDEGSDTAFVQIDDASDGYTGTASMPRPGVPANPQTVVNPDPPLLRPNNTVDDAFIDVKFNFTPPT